MNIWAFVDFTLLLKGLGLNCVVFEIKADFLFIFNGISI